MACNSTRPQGFSTLAREPSSVTGRESEETYGSFSCNGSSYRRVSFAWPRGLYCKVWGVCELQASNLSCNLSSLIHSMRRTICCHKKEWTHEILGIKYVVSCFVVVQQKATFLSVS